MGLNFSCAGCGNPLSMAGMSSVDKMAVSVHPCGTCVEQEVSKRTIEETEKRQKLEARVSGLRNSMSLTAKDLENILAEDDEQNAV